jgi:hypothetical protein
MRGFAFASERGQMFQSRLLCWLVLVSVVSFASSSVFAQSGRGAGNSSVAPAATTAPVDKPAATPKMDKSSSNLLKNTATGKHLQKTQ